MSQVLRKLTRIRLDIKRSEKVDRETNGARLEGAKLLLPVKLSRSRISSTELASPIPKEAFCRSPANERMIQIIRRMQTLNISARKVSKEIQNSTSVIDGEQMTVKKQMLFAVATQLQQKYDQLQSLFLAYSAKKAIPLEIQETCDEYIHDIRDISKAMLKLQKELVEIQTKKDQYITPIDMPEEKVHPTGKIDKKMLRQNVPTCGDAIHAASTFSTFFEKFVSNGESEDWNRAMYMQGLDFLLHGEPHQIYSKLKKNKADFQEIVEVLRNKYSVDESAAKHKKEIAHFTRGKGESLLAAMSRFKILLTSTQCFYQESMRASRIDMEMLNGLRTMVTLKVRKAMEAEEERAEMNGGTLPLEYLTQKCVAWDRKFNDEDYESQPVKLCLQAMTMRDAPEQLNAVATRGDRSKTPPSIRKEIKPDYFKDKKGEKEAFSRKKLRKQGGNRGGKPELPPIGMEVDTDPFLHKSEYAFPGAYAEAKRESSRSDYRSPSRDKFIRDWDERSRKRSTSAGRGDWRDGEDRRGQEDRRGGDDYRSREDRRRQSSERRAAEEAWRYGGRPGYGGAQQGRPGEGDRRGGQDDRRGPGGSGWDGRPRETGQPKDLRVEYRPPLSWDDLAVAKQMLENAKKKQAFTGTHVSPTSGFANPNARRQYDKTRPTSPGDYKKGKYYDPGYPDRRTGTYKASPYNQDSAKARTTHPVSASYMAQGPTNIDVKMFVEQKPEGTNRVLLQFMQES